MIVKKQILTVALILTVGSMQAQSPAIDAWRDNLGNTSSIFSHTYGALGIGILIPEGKTEIKYCLPNGQYYSGLIVTKSLCTPPLPGGGIVIPGSFDDVPTGEGGGGNGGNPVAAITPSHSYASVTPLNFPLHTFPSNMEPLVWARVETPASTPDPGKNDSRFIVYPDGRSGINIADPRCALDVRGFGINAPAAIFGVNAIRPAIDPNALVPRRYTRHIEIVPHLGYQGYNSISQEKDLGILFSDGLGDEGSNLEGALVIAPWREDGGSGGLRMEANGNTELRGDLRCTKLTVNAKWWPDAVFASSYQLMPLRQVDSFIQANRHLPGIPCEDSVLNNGQDVGALQVLQQQKIEELTLYTIEQEKSLIGQQLMITQQRELIASQEQQLKKQEARLNRLEALLIKK